MSFGEILEVGSGCFNKRFFPVGILPEKVWITVYSSGTLQSDSKTIATNFIAFLLNNFSKKVLLIDFRGIFVNNFRPKWCVYPPLPPKG